MDAGEGCEDLQLPSPVLTLESRLPQAAYLPLGAEDLGLLPFTVSVSKIKGAAMSFYFPRKSTSSF